MCTRAHTQSPHAHIPARGGTQRAQDWAPHKAHMLTHTHTEACMEPMYSYTHGHAQSPCAYMEARWSPPCSHAHAGLIWLAAALASWRLAPCHPFCQGPSSKNSKTGAAWQELHVGRHSMASRLLSTAARLSEELAVFLETLTCGHFPLSCCS